MNNNFINFGEPLRGLTPEDLQIPLAKQTLKACRLNSTFEVIELRRILDRDNLVAEVIVADCTNDRVPTQNSAGILYTERIGLVFFTEESKLPEVRTLRQNFPVLPHQNHVQDGEPYSLCLYAEIWNIVQRYWTPQHHLNRVLWWMEATAKGTLHDKDQPVEQIFFQGSSEVILPQDFDESVQNKDLFLALAAVECPNRNLRTFIGKFVKIGNTASSQNCLVVTIDPVTHAGVEPFPTNLGELEDRLVSRGSSFISRLQAEIRRIVTQDGIPKRDNDWTLIVLAIPIRRVDGAEPEKIELRGYFVKCCLGLLGEKCDALSRLEDKFYATPLIFDTSLGDGSGCRPLEVLPVELLRAMSPKDANRFSGIEQANTVFNGLLAGVGALGSNLAEIWYRQGWGNWTFVDQDRLQPHNLARHIGKFCHLGQYKVDVVADMVEATYQRGAVKVTTFVDNAVNWTNSELKTSVLSADLVVDATTTLGVPRDLAIASICRGATVFLTPDGLGAILMMEDSQRTVRLDSLESQYYRAILNNEWGKGHLTSHFGRLRVGAGCGDTSTIMPTDLVQLHAATLARHIRLASKSSESSLRIWHVDPITGGVDAYDIPSATQRTTAKSGWDIVYDDNLLEKVRDLRQQNIPNETGGILIGYPDQKIRRVYICDALSAPVDSAGDRTGFTRGKEGLLERLSAIHERTANMVSYIGEWHSHPPGSTSMPSAQDLGLLLHLGKEMMHEGLPVVMLIVAEGGITWGLHGTDVYP